MRQVFFLLLCCFFFLGQAASVLAHGGGTLQIVNAPIAEAYQVSVWSAPPTIRARDDIHITVGVADLVDGSPVLDTAVLVEFYNAMSGELIVSESATTEQSINRLFYEADIPGLPQGDYEVVVTVTGEEGSGSVDFALNIRPYLNLPLILGASIAIILFLGGGLLLFRRSQSRTEQPQRLKAEQ